MRSHLLNLPCCSLILLVLAWSSRSTAGSLSLLLLVFEDHSWSLVFWPSINPLLLQIMFFKCLLVLVALFLSGCSDLHDPQGAVLKTGSETLPAVTYKSELMLSLYNLSTKVTISSCFVEPQAEEIITNFSLNFKCLYVREEQVLSQVVGSYG